MPDGHAGCLFLLGGDFNVEKFSGNPFNGVIDVGFRIVLSFMQRDIDSVHI